MLPFDVYRTMHCVPMANQTAQRPPTTMTTTTLIETTIPQEEEDYVFILLV